MNQNTKNPTQFCWNDLPLISFSSVKMCQKMKTSVKSANNDTAALDSTSFRKKSNSSPEKKILKLAYETIYRFVQIYICFCGYNCFYLILNKTHRDLQLPYIYIYFPPAPINMLHMIIPFAHVWRCIIW